MIGSRSGIVLLFAGCLLAFNSACGPNESILNSNKETPVPSESKVETAVSTFEQDLQTMRTADFDFIYVFRRKDGGKFDAEDRTILRVNTSESNRRKITDDDRAIIVGSNYRIPGQNLSALIERFALEDHSKPESEIKRGNANN
jgi:hypothetical protein